MLKPSNEQAYKNSSRKKVSEKTWVELKNVQDPPNSTKGDVSVEEAAKNSDSISTRRERRVVRPPAHLDDYVVVALFAGDG